MKIFREMPEHRRDLRNKRKDAAGAKVNGSRGRCQRFLSVAAHLSTKARGLLWDLFRGGEVRRKPSPGNHGVFSAAEYRQ